MEALSVPTARILTLVFVLVVLVAVVVAAQPAAQPPQEKINVFAVVSPNIEQAVHEAATALRDEEGLESFPLQGFQIHCTLYMTQYPAGRQAEILPKVEEFASTTKIFPTTTTGLEITSGNWFFLNLERNSPLQTASDRMVELLAPLRAQSDYVPDWAKEFPAKVEFISKYGSPNVFGEFNPHLTLLAPSDEAKLRTFLTKHADSSFAKPIAGQVVAIGVGIADRNGQVKEPWKIFPLQQPN